MMDTVQDGTRAAHGVRGYCNWAGGMGGWGLMMIWCLCVLLGGTVENFSVACEHVQEGVLNSAG